MILEFSWQLFEKKKISNIKFLANPSSGCRVVPRGWTDGQTWSSWSLSQFCKRAYKNEDALTYEVQENCQNLTPHKTVRKVNSCPCRKLNLKPVQLVGLPIELNWLLNRLCPLAYWGPPTTACPPDASDYIKQHRKAWGWLQLLVRIFSWHLTESVSGYNCLCDASSSDEITLCNRFTTAGSDQSNHPSVQRIQ